MAHYSEEEIDRRVSDWHGGAGEGLSLAQYLGMSDEEYKEWVEDPPFCPDWVSPPGNTIERILEERKLSHTSFARMMGIGFGEVDFLLIGRTQIDGEIAEKLSTALGSTKRFWLARETNYRNGMKRLGLTPP